MTEEPRGLEGSGAEEVPEEVQEAFLDRLKEALRGDDQAARDVAGVLEAEGVTEETTEEQLGFLAGIVG